MYPWSFSSSSSRAASAAAAETAVNVAEGGSQEEAGARMTFAAAGQGPSSLSHRHPQQQQSPPSSAWQLVEQRQQRSTWGRPIQPLGPGGGGEEPSRMHQLISKIGNGASAGIVRPLPCMAPSSATSLTETPAAAAAVVVDATTSTFMAEDRAGITADSASSLASSLSPEWRVVELRCKSHAHEVALLDRRGRSCLHAACAKKPPVSTVEAILKANTTGTSKSSAASSAILLQRDKHGRTPLLIAIASHADLPVIAFLLQKSHEAGAVSDHLGNSPLMLACEACNNKNPVDDHQVELVRLLLQAFPEAAQRESLNGRMALHVAVECNAPTAVVAQLVQGMYM
jgi:Ankyrin repeat